MIPEIREQAAAVAAIREERYCCRVEDAALKRALAVRLEAEELRLAEMLHRHAETLKGGR